MSGGTHAALDAFYAAVFLGFMILAHVRPREQRLSNGLVVLAAALLALWYRPAMPSLLFGSGASGAMSWPLHRLLAFPLSIAALWVLILHWEDAKSFLARRRRRDPRVPD